MENPEKRKKVKAIDRKEFTTFAPDCRWPSRHNKVSIAGYVRFIVTPKDGEKTSEMGKSFLETA